MSRTSPSIWLMLLVSVVAVMVLGCRTSARPPSARDGTVATPATHASPATATPTARTTYPLAVQTSNGRTISIGRAPERIVCLSPGHTEILFAIGAGGRVVGTDRFSDFPEAAKSLPKLDYSNTNLEALVALRPDLVIASTRQRTLVPAFEQAGLRVLFLEEPGGVAEVIRRVRLLGEVTDHRPEAEALAVRLEERIAAVTEKVKGVAAGPRVYHEVDPKLFSAAPTSFVGDLYTLLKVQNIAQAGTNPFPQLTAGAIIRADPEVIVLGAARLPGGSPDEVKRRPGWDVISAVRHGRVVAVEADLVSRPGPRLVDGLEQIAKLLYPDLFRSP